MTRFLLALVLLAASGASAARINTRISKAAKEKAHLQAEESQKVNGSTAKLLLIHITVALVHTDGEPVQTWDRSLAGGYGGLKSEVETFIMTPDQTVKDLKAQLKYTFSTKNWPMTHIYGVARNARLGNASGNYLLEDNKETLERACGEIKPHGAVYFVPDVLNCRIYWDIGTQSPKAKKAKEAQQVTAAEPKIWTIGVEMVDGDGHRVWEDYHLTLGSDTEKVKKLKESLQRVFAKEIAQEKWHVERLYGRATNPRLANRNGEYVLEEGETFQSACENVRTDPEAPPFQGFLLHENPCQLFWDVKSPTAETTRPVVVVAVNAREEVKDGYWSPRLGDAATIRDLKAILDLDAYNFKVRDFYGKTTNGRYNFEDHQEVPLKEACEQLTSAMGKCQIFVRA